MSIFITFRSIWFKFEYFLFVIAKCHCQATATRELRKPNRKSNNYSSIPVCETCSLTVSLNEPDLQIVSREEMILQSVVCISGVHFTAFTRYDLSNDNSTWLYFDSMSGAGPEVSSSVLWKQYWDIHHIIFMISTFSGKGGSYYGTTADLARKSANANHYGGVGSNCTKELFRLSFMFLWTSNTQT